MSNQTWQETLVNSLVDGTQILNSVTQASIIPPAAKYTLPANFFSVGKILKVTAHGRISNVVTTPGTLAFQILFGATAVFNPTPTTIPLNIVAKTDVAWWLEIVGTCRSLTGTTSNIMWQGQFSSESVVGSPAGAAGSAMLLPSTPVVGSNFDNSVAQVVDLQAKFSVATATTSLTCHQYKVESLN